MPVTADRVLGLVLLGVGALVAIPAWTIDEGFGAGTLAPRFFPLLLCALLALIGVVLLARGGGAPLARLLPGARALGFMGLLLAYFLSFTLGDYRLWTFAFLLGAMAWLGERRWPRLLALPALASLALYALFRHGFGVVLPAWW